MTSTNYSKSAFVVSVGSILSFGVGTATQIVIASIFGASREMDAYFTAIVLPTFFSGVITTGLNFVLIPAIIREQEYGRNQDARKLVSTVLVTIFTILVLITIIIEVNSNQIIKLYAPGMEPDSQLLSASILRIQILALPFMGIGSLAGGVQNSYDSFFRPAIAPAVGSILNLVIVLISNKYIGVYSLALGGISSIMVISLINLLPVLLTHKLEFLPLMDVRIIKLWILMIPFVLFGIIQRSSPVIERYFASGLSDGQLSYLGYSSKITNVMKVLFGTGIATSIFPALSRKYLVFGNKGLIELSEKGLKLTIALVIPSIFFFWVAGNSFVDLFLGYGKFDEITIRSVGNILWLSAVFVGYGLIGNILGRTFYAMEITWFTPIISTLEIFLYIVLVASFGNDANYIGLMKAKVLAKTASILLLLFVLFIYIKSLFKSFWKLFIGLFIGGSMFGFLLKYILSTIFIGDEAIVMITVFCALIFFTSIIYYFDQEVLKSLKELFGINRLQNIYNK